MDTKLKIDITNGIIEVEGSENFVKLIYSDYKESFNVKTIGLKRETKKRADRGKVSPNGGKKERPQKHRSVKGPHTPKINASLDLAASGSLPSLETFYNQYKPSNNYENNLIFCYYLQNIRKNEDTSIDDIFTCYRKLKLKLPRAFKQNLSDTSRRRGWINTSSLEKITLQIAGVNYIEHDMKKAGDE